jgi:two-component system LytT family response regulator
MQIKAMIFDSDPVFRRAFSQLLSAYPTLEMVGEAGRVEEAKKLISQEQADVVFTDIRLMGEAVAPLLPQISVSMDLVFVSDYPDYAVRAFEVHALDYLLKPVSAVRFSATMARLRQCGPCERSFLAQGGGVELHHRICLKTDRGREVVYVDDIGAIVSNGNYTSVYLQDRIPLFIRRSLAAWKKMLPRAHFLQIHRGCLINTHHVESLRKEADGRHVIHSARHKATFTVSKRMLLEVKARLSSLLMT